MFIEILKPFLQLSKLIRGSSPPMETNHRNTGGDGEFELHYEIIHQIQSLMPATDAARTSLLSRCWHDAWCTRPDIDLNQYKFRHRMDEFPAFARGTLRRYEDSELQITSFRLWMKIGHNPLAAELISRAIRLGVVDLKIEIETDTGTSSCVLPEEVLQSQTLTRLHVSGLTIDLQKQGVTNCPKLKFLTVSNATVNGDLFRDLVSRCPLIEELIWNGRPWRRADWNSNSRIDVEEFDKLGLDKLKHLRLAPLDATCGYAKDVKDALYRHDLSPKFPCLKKLVIWDNHSSHVRICSASLESITIRRVQHESCNWIGEFDVPNLRKFRMSGSHVPHLVINTRRCAQWESYIDINCCMSNPVSWFSSLNQLGMALSLSRLFLSLCMDIRTCRGHGGHIGDAGFAVKKLTLYGHSLTLGFLDSLLWSCRPELLNVERRCVSGMVDPHFTAQDFPQLRSLPWKTLFDHSSYRGQFVQFRLN